MVRDIRAPELGDFDILADVTPAARKRGMQVYALFEEAYNPRLITNFERIAEVVRQDVTIEDGTIKNYRVRLGISFKYDSGD